MNPAWYASYFVKILGFKAFRAMGFPGMMPSNVAYSVTNCCNSRCRTCNIWKKYQEKPALAKDELTTDEWIKTWKSVGKTDFVIFTGGEPFLRRDSLELLKGVYDFNHPSIMNICSNGLLPQRIGRDLEEFLKYIGKNVDLTLNMSIDGIGPDHDHVRGVNGNWKKLLETIKVAKKLRDKYGYPNIGLHTVVSKWNYSKVPQIYDYVVKNLMPDTYIMEPAELRNELGTMSTDILPSRDKLAKVFRVYSSGKNVTKITKMIREIYIEKYIKGSGLPCYASFNHTQITANGNVWPCCILADEMKLGNVRDVGFDFRKVWFSERANEVREKIKGRKIPECDGCYLAVVANTSIPQNMMLTAKHMLSR